MEHNQDSNYFAGSIFDTDSTNTYKLWKSCSRNTKLQEELKTEIPLLKGYAGKTSRTRNGVSVIKDRFFVLTNKHLFYRKTEEVEKLGAYLELKWARMETHKELCESPNEQEPSTTKYTIKIIKNLKFTSLFFDDYQTFYMWRQALIKANVI